MKCSDHSHKFKIPSDYFQLDQEYTKNPTYFKKCKMSLIALLKIMNHA